MHQGNGYPTGQPVQPENLAAYHSICTASQTFLRLGPKWQIKCLILEFTLYYHEVLVKDNL